MTVTATNSETTIELEMASAMSRNSWAACSRAGGARSAAGQDRAVTPAGLRLVELEGEVKTSGVSTRPVLFSMP